MVYHQTSGGQAELQRSAEEILAGVRRPCQVAQVDTLHYSLAPGLEFQRPGQEFRAVNLSSQDSFEVKEIYIRRE